MIRRLLLSVLLAWSAYAHASATSCVDAAWAGEHEVFYKIFVRSFADSDGDRIGDLRGSEMRMGYLQQLGITSLLLTPIVPSGYYHNYFATRFNAVDPAYGTLASYRRLVKAAHARGMKVFLDQEIQYVDEDHPWWRDSAGRPESAYSRHILYNEPGNRSAETGFMGTLQLHAYDGRPIRLAMLNLYEPAVRTYFEGLFDFWIDPDADGKLDDGVDGFRIDHMMDDLDGRGKLTNLVAGFWAPLIAHARARNPRLIFIAEQADWGSLGADLQQRGDIDLVYAFALRRAIVAMDAPAIAAALAATQSATTAGKGQLVFVENHDTDRFASGVDDDPRKLRLGAALTVMLKGSPLLYYGQELGMRGRQLHLPGASDGNDIPVREAFRWQRKLASAGSAIWYRDLDPWWSGRFSHDDDGVSVAEQSGKPASLLEHYRRLLRLRGSHPELQAGAQCVLRANHPAVLAVLRESRDAATLLLVNTSGESREVVVPVEPLNSRKVIRLSDLLAGRRSASLGGGEVTARMDGYGVLLLKLPNQRAH